MDRRSLLYLSGGVLSDSPRVSIASTGRKGGGTSISQRILVYCKSIQDFNQTASSKVLGGGQKRGGALWGGGGGGGGLGRGWEGF